MNGQLIRCGGTIWRVLEENDRERQVLVVDCLKKTMPVWKNVAEWSDAKEIPEQELLEAEGITAESLEAYDPAPAHRRFSMIAPILPVIGRKKERSVRIREAAELFGADPQTIRQYLCRYLVFRDIRVLAPVKKPETRELTADEKNMRWALNKYYYSNLKWPLTTVYVHLLKEKYTDSMGQLMEPHPSIRQFRYFCSKHEKLQTRYISRDGLKDYQRNNRPLLGDGVQEFASASGWAMLDSTVCDIYLVNEEGQLVGRPVLVAGIDAYSGICLGYALAWEGGTYSLRGLMLSVLEDKAEHCRKYGIPVEDRDWPCRDELPGVMITDMGSEYTSGTFEQIAELGVTVINLPAYRPELKGPVESFFHTVQGYYKDELKGQGVIEPDFQERGAHDYRLDACLTLEDFEKVLLRCIVYYNSQRVAEDFPYTEEMLDAEVKPYANKLYAYGKTLPGVNLIPCTREELILTLLPRTSARFQRDGLRVNGMRYRDTSEDHAFTEDYLRGGSAVVAYNPDDVSRVWLMRGRKSFPFLLVESRFAGKSIEKTVSMKERQRALVQAEQEKNLQSKIDLVEHIQVISARAGERQGNVQVRQIRQTRQKERARNHKDYTRGIEPARIG